MDPLKEAIKLARRPVELAQQAVNRPMARSPGTVAGLLLGGGSLRDAVDERVIMVTGASSGIGEATAIHLGHVGATVVLVARSEDRLQSTARKVRDEGGSAHVLPCDLTDLEAIDALVEQVEDRLGRVDVLINNAGKSIRRSLDETYDRFHDYERTMALNYFGPVRLMLGLLPGMRERRFGHVVNISSAGILARAPRFGAYIASKAALDTLSDAWQAETQSQNVRFTTIYMPLVRTPMIEPTKIYDRFPALSPRQAGDVVCEAIVNRPRRVTPVFGRVASMADAVSPQFMDLVRNRGYALFADDSVSDAGEAFARLTRGVHW